ncbi:MAG: peptidoglycan DD-metalloendopeptidase family protein [Saprospiraceae bacterium]
MGKEKFVFNRHTLSYERVRLSIKHRLIRIFGFMSAVIVTGMLFMTITNTFFPSQKEKALQREIEQMKIKYESVNGQLDMMSKVLSNLQDRDASVHRMMFGMDPIDQAVWNGGIGGHESYRDLTKFQQSGELLVNTLEKADKLERQLVIQSLSLDTIQKMAERMNEMHSSLPAIKPVREDKLNRNVRSLSGFGMRIHPILKVRKMHTGLDFGAPRGTAVQVTGDGKVVEVTRDNSGYGLHIIVDHGFGYKTLYGHMEKADVKVGQKVTRGQHIGTIGNSGRSTAPHLHYEVIYKGQKVNPIHYVIDGLTLEEYSELVEKASASNVSFDY